MVYKIEITETLQSIIEVEAENMQEAMEIVQDRYHDELIVLDHSNLTDTNFEFYQD